MTKLQQTFIRNLRVERDRAGLTQEEVAEKSGIAHKYYNAIELGYKFPSVQIIEKLALTLHIAPFRLFMGSDQIQGMPPSDLIDSYHRLIQDKIGADLASAKAEFLRKLKDVKR